MVLGCCRLPLQLLLTASSSLCLSHRAVIPTVRRTPQLQNRRIAFAASNVQSPIMAAAKKKPRRSARIQALHSGEVDPPPNWPPKRARKRTLPPPSNVDGAADGIMAAAVEKKTKLPDCLPRKRETELLLESKKASCGDTNNIKYVMGIDEAGRGPLAGPVVAAAAIVPVDIAGVVDSKKLTKEAVREELYETIVSSRQVRWACAVVDSLTIDKINILQATMKAMSMAARAVIDGDSSPQNGVIFAKKACTSQTGCYVVSNTKARDNAVAGGKSPASEGKELAYYALVDGNRTPKDMPCEAEFIIHGDSKEYSIAAASILAKVTRDRLMHDYDKLYSDYGLKQHKGYPTKAHMAAVYKFGASPIHRRTFAPLKHMKFDRNGRVIQD